MTATLELIHSKRGHDVTPKWRRKTLFWSRLGLLLATFTVHSARAAQEGDFIYTDNGSTITINGYATGAPTDVAVPATIIGKPVTAIASSAFATRTEITSVTLPSNVTSIGTSGFFYCTSLTSVTFSSNLTSIGDQAFYNCIQLANITIPAGVTTLGTNVFSSCSGLQSVAFLGPVTTIGNSTFYGCSNLVSLMIPSTVTTLGTNAFASCSSLTGITIPSGVTILPTGVFAGCGGLQSVTIPGTVISIGTQAFQNCTGLTSLTISSGVQTVGNQAFRNCFGLTSVTIPASVTSLVDKAFYNCTALAEVFFRGNAPTIGAQVFDLTAPVTIYHTAEATGYDVAPWTSYALGITTFDPVADWLTANGLAGNSNLLSDDNHDGVSLLMAYALNLNPNQNLSGNLPQVVFSAGLMSLTYLEATDDVTYVVETSDDMANWSTNGVTMSELDVNHYRTATVPIAGQKRYMRLSFSR